MKALALICLAIVFCGICRAQTNESAPRPVVVSAQLKSGAMVYKVNGKIVEDRAQNRSTAKDIYDRLRRAERATSPNAIKTPPSTKKPAVGTSMNRPNRALKKGNQRT